MQSICHLICCCCQAQQLNMPTQRICPMLCPHVRGSAKYEVRGCGQCYIGYTWDAVRQGNSSVRRAQQAEVRRFFDFLRFLLKIFADLKRTSNRSTLYRGHRAALRCTRSLHHFFDFLGPTSHATLRMESYYIRVGMGDDLCYRKHRSTATQQTVRQQPGTLSIAQHKPSEAAAPLQLAPTVCMFQGTVQEIVAAYLPISALSCK